MLIGEMAAYHRNRGMTLYEALQEMFEKYSYHLEGITSFTLEGKEGIEKISSAMDALRAEKSVGFGTCNVETIRDYLLKETTNVRTGEKVVLDLPFSNVLYYELTDGSWFCIRPSGTEPKIKIYYGVAESTLEKAQNKLEDIKENVVTSIRKLLY